MSTWQRQRQLFATNFKKKYFTIHFVLILHFYLTVYIISIEFSSFFYISKS